MCRSLRNIASHYCIFKHRFGRCRQVRQCHTLSNKFKSSPWCRKLEKDQIICIKATSFIQVCRQLNPLQIKCPLMNEYWKFLILKNSLTIIWLWLFPKKPLATPNKELSSVNSTQWKGKNTSSYNKQVKKVTTFVLLKLFISPDTSNTLESWHGYRPLALHFILLVHTKKCYVH